MSETKTHTNPFPGLRPFETNEYRLFFGREGQSDALIERLQRARFLAVVGTSGSGKSSLVRAGLMPALRGGMIAGAGWRVAVMRPGHDPVGNLASVLAEEGVLAELGAGLPPAEAEAIIEATLRRGSLGLIDAARQARLAPHEKLLVVVDQFEELFRFRAARATTDTDDDASAFVKLLIEAKQADKPTEERLPIYVVLTMRSDFLGDCAQFQGLPEVINDGQYLIPRMTRDERRFAISGPVRVSRGKITEPLVNRLLNEVGDNPDQLPILQHALMRTWDYWRQHRRDGSEPIGIEHYEAVGTMSDALSLHADEAFNELPDERSRHIAEQLFRALTERGADNREIRRPTSLREVCDIAGASEAEVVAVIEVFRLEGRSFLMPPAGVALTSETVIDISHESLIRNWQRLKEWVRDEAEAARIYRRLADAAVAYRTGEGGLLDDVTLQWVLKWRDKYAPTPAWGVRYHPEFDAALAYLEESRAAREAAAQEHERKQQEELERERREREQAERFAEEQRRAAKRLRRYLYAMVALMLLSVVAGGWGWAAQQRAVAAQGKALTARQIAEQERAKVVVALDETNRARTEAERSRDIAQSASRKAEEQAEIAEKEKLKAQSEKERAQAAEDKAEEASVEAKRQAVEARRAEQEAKRQALALQANGKFRDATILAERGEYSDAAKMYEATIKGLQENGVKDTEGVADTYVQLGQTYFGAMQDTEMTLYENYNHVTQAVESYDQAVKHYEEASVPLKAADTLLSVGATLLKIANDVPIGRRVSRASEELAALALPNRLIMTGGVIHFSEEDDPKVMLKNQALERYKRAFLFYRKAGNEDGMMQAAYRIGNFYLRDELPGWRDKTPTLDIALCNGTRQEFISNRQKALCYFKELERLSLSRGKKDADIQRLLVWIGGINLEMAQSAAGESYVNRAQQAYLQRFDAQPGAQAATGQGWADAAETAETATLSYTAQLLYDRALKVYEKASDHSGKALMDFKTGDLIRRQGIEKPGTSTTQLALAHFKDAVEAFKQKLKAGNVNDNHDWRDEFFTIGLFAEDNYDEALALDAYNAALALGEARHDELMQARAWSGIASVQTQSAPEIARQSYMRSFALYSQLRDGVAVGFTVPMGGEYLKELERISAAVLALDREIKAKALAEHKAQAEWLCPFPVIAYAQPTATEGDTVTFSAYAVYPEESKLTYEWTLSSPAATIVERILKPYPAVRVSTNGVGKGDLTATLVVSDSSGGDACRQTALATTKVALRPPIPMH